MLIYSYDARAPSWKVNKVPGYSLILEGNNIGKESAITLWLFNIAMENCPFIDDFPSYKPPFILGIFHGYVSHNQMLTILLLGNSW